MKAVSSLLVPNGADHLLEFRARHHDEMPASQALEPEVHAGAQDLPFTRAARMCFFHAHDVADGILLFFHHILEASYENLDSADAGRFRPAR